MRKATILAVSVLVSACSMTEQPITDAAETVGSIEIFDSSANSLLSSDAKISVRGTGFKWTEGPVWVDGSAGTESGYLLFSDIPSNQVIKYEPNVGTSVYLENSGATCLVEGDYTIQGSNALLVNDKQQLVLLQQSDRRIAVMDSPLDAPVSKYTTLVGDYQGKRLNSPNDGVYHSDGSLYFTDPPYGLMAGIDDKRKELDYQGIYRLTAEGSLILLDDSVSFPNGIALSIDERTLYVAVSDHSNPHWLAYDVLDDGSLANKRVFFDAKDMMDPNSDKGLPDGMAVHSSGNIFATGPGGVWLFSPDGQVLAKIRTEHITANCALTSNEDYLFITAHETLLSVPLVNIK